MSRPQQQQKGGTSCQKHPNLDSRTRSSSSSWSSSSANNKRKTKSSSAALVLVDDGVVQAGGHHQQQQSKFHFRPIVNNKNSAPDEEDEVQAGDHQPSTSPRPVVTTTTSASTSTDVLLVTEEDSKLTLTPKQHDRTTTSTTLAMMKKTKQKSRVYFSPLPSSASESPFLVPPSPTPTTMTSSSSSSICSSSFRSSPPFACSSFYSPQHSRGPRPHSSRSSSVTTTSTMIGSGTTPENMNNNVVLENETGMRTPMSFERMTNPMTPTTPSSNAINRKVSFSTALMDTPNTTSTSTTSSTPLSSKSLSMFSAFDYNYDEENDKNDGDVVQVVLDNDYDDHDEEDDPFNYDHHYYDSSFECCPPPRPPRSYFVPNNDATSTIVAHSMTGAAVTTSTTRRSSTLSPSLVDNDNDTASINKPKKSLFLVPHSDENYSNNHHHHHNDNYYYNHHHGSYNQRNNASSSSEFFFDSGVQQSYNHHNGSIINDVLDHHVPSLVVPLAVPAFNLPSSPGPAPTTTNDSKQKNALTSLSRRNGSGSRFSNSGSSSHTSKGSEDNGTACFSANGDSKTPGQYTSSFTKNNSRTTTPTTKTKKYKIVPKFTRLEQSTTTSASSSSHGSGSGVFISSSSFATTSRSGMKPNIGTSTKSSFTNVSGTTKQTSSDLTDTSSPDCGDAKNNRDTTTPVVSTNASSPTSNASSTRSFFLSLPSSACATTAPSHPSSPMIKKGNLLKTEFCKFILNGQKCKFGSLCNFAHNEDELNLKTLFERHDAGLLDKDTLRTRPCFDFVSTGSCPFGIRCSSIHDPRIMATNKKHQCWLPHCSLETKNLNTDLHIDWFRNYSFMETHYGHGLGQDFGLVSNATVSGSCRKGPTANIDDGIGEAVTAMKTFDEFYQKVIESCAPSSSSILVLPSVHYTKSLANVNQSFVRNVTSSSSSSGSIATTSKMDGQEQQSKVGKTLLTEAQRIEIELQMRTLKKDDSQMGDKKSFSKTVTSHAFTSSTALYKYKPSHIIFNEMCMILQTRTFDISNDCSTKHINSSSGRESNRSCVTGTVREIEMDAYDSKNPDHLLVYDIAFGLAGSSNNGSNTGHMTINENNRMRALWFHVQEGDVHECTLQERMNYKKTSRKLEKLKKIQDVKVAAAASRATTNLSNIDCYCRHNHANVVAALKSFDINQEIYQNGFIEKPIIMNLPMDRDLFSLTTEVLKHRLAALKGYGTVKYENEELLRIQQKFVSLKSHIQKICFWPINNGREVVDANTSVPKVDEQYKVPFHAPLKNDFFLEAKEEFHFQDKVWESFIVSAGVNFEQNPVYNKDGGLPFFKKLAVSTSVMKDTNVRSSNGDIILHHIKGCSDRVNNDSNASFLDVDSKCWNSLLLGKDHGDWNMVKFFYASRN